MGPSEWSVPPDCPFPKSLRLGDDSRSVPSEAAGENLPLPARGGRRHSDFTGLASHHHHSFTTHRGPVCPAFQFLLHMRSKEGKQQQPHCPCDLRHHLTSGAATSLGYGRHKGSSDCSNFSLLQKSLLNIISRKAAACPTAPSQQPPPHPSAALRLTCSAGDGNLTGPVPSGRSFGDKEPTQDWEDRFCAREQLVTSGVGLVGHRRGQILVVSLVGICPRGNAFICMELRQSPVPRLSPAPCIVAQS